MRIKRSLFKPRAKAGSYKIENKTEEKEPTRYIYDEIGWFGVEAGAFAKDLAEIKADTIHIRINSPGGNVFDGTAIANAIKASKAKIIIHIDGIAASISSIIALAGDEVYMADNAFFMFHEAWSITIGNADNLRDEADLLDKIDGALANTYVQKTGKGEKEIKKLMRAETWLTAEEALEMGMIDKIETNEKDEKAKATLFDLSVFANVPDQLKGENEIDINERDLERALRDAGCSRNQAKEILAKGFQNEREAQTEPVNQNAREAQTDNKPPQRDAEKPEKIKDVKTKDRTAELLTRGEELAPTRHIIIKEVLAK